jgi:hypothetical protein
VTLRRWCSYRRCLGRAISATNALWPSRPHKHGSITWQVELLELPIRLWNFAEFFWMGLTWQLGVRRWRMASLATVTACLDASDERKLAHSAGQHPRGLRRWPALELSDLLRRFGCLPLVCCRQRSGANQLSGVIFNSRLIHDGTVIQFYDLYRSQPTPWTMGCQCHKIILDVPST